MPDAGAISGTFTVCPASVSSLSETVSGGTWSSSSTAIATVNATGVVTGIAAGLDSIFYSYTNSCGTAVVHTVITVNPMPDSGAISGTDSVCPAAITSLSETVAGGVWSSSATGTASVNATGTVRGITSGSANITYTVTNSCGSASTYFALTVSPLPAAGIISGTFNVCAGGATTSLSETVAGGTWSSDSTAIATVNATGVVTGIAAGTDSVFYTYTNSCGTALTHAIITVNPLPDSGAISGIDSVCPTATITLSETVSGGVWSSSATGTASINAAGAVTGVMAGAATISYTYTNSCGSATTSVVVTVDPLPDAGIISGTLGICPGTSSSLSETVSAGIWSGHSAAIATVNATGVVTGVAAGTDSIFYSFTNSCGTARSNIVITVNPLPDSGAISGVDSVCPGATTPLYETVIGGVWSSSATSVATINASGVVAGVTAGTATISYVYTNFCGSATTTYNITVDPSPAVATISGTTSVCVSSAITLSDSTSGGIWSISNSHASISGAMVTGVLAGNDTVLYSYTNSCGTAVTSYLITINPLPNAGTITGYDSVCPGATITLSDGMSPGVWSSTDTTIATIDSVGIVAGVANGATTISYAYTNMCGTAYTWFPVTVNPLPYVGAITGIFTVCATTTTSLADSVAGGIWHSAATGTATVNASGVLYGTLAGTTLISYSYTNVCGTATATQIITVAPQPNAGSITGAAVVCNLATITLFDAVSGGSWSSGDSAVAAVTGDVVTGESVGSATVSYTYTNSCGTAYAVKNITVNPLPYVSALSGPSAVCLGDTIYLTDSVAGGIWVSTAPTIAPVISGGIAGLTTGSTVISYSYTNSCGTAVALKIVSVNSIITPLPITGLASVCVGANITMTDATTGGTWSVSSPLLSVNSAGIVTGVSGGTDTLTYTMTNMCGSAFVTKVITINPLANPGIISGTAAICIGDTTYLADTISGGTWSSSNALVATITSTGKVMGIASGTDTIKYGVTGFCGTAYAYFPITVNPLPPAITGPATLCLGSTATYTDIDYGGSWSTASIIASISSPGGVLSGTSTGPAIITYTLPSGCITTRTLTVSTLPVVAALSGGDSVCAGSAILLTETTTGGVWLSNNTGAATVASGLVHGISADTVTINYSVTNYCGTTTVSQLMNVQPLPVAGTITGTATICQGAVATLADTATGGTWSASNSRATVLWGVVTGVTPGADTIKYTVTNYCGTQVARKVITIQPLPLAGYITGPANICVGLSSTLFDSTASGTAIWNSSNGSAVILSPGGIITGVYTGTDTITLHTSNSCGSVDTNFVVNVTTLPDPGTIVGTDSLCQGATMTYTDTAAAGIWSLSNGNASIISGGIIQGISSGSDVLYYTVGNVCGEIHASLNINIKGLANSGIITGPDTICTGSSNLFTATASGGVWSLTNGLATLSGYGMVNCVNAGTDTLMYTVTNSCNTSVTSKTVALLLPADPGTIYGADSVCIGGASLVGDSAVGGVWTSSNFRATINTVGLLTGISVGIDSVYYTVANYCGTFSTMREIHVDSLPVAPVIVAPATLCVGGAVVVSADLAGGTWSLTNTKATISNDTLRAISVGTDTLNYHYTNACGSTYGSAIISLVVLPVVQPITGIDSLCRGNLTTLSDSTAGGVWTSHDAYIATISETGLVFGIAAGPDVISYSVSNVCGTTVKTVTVYVMTPGAEIYISGSTLLCDSSSARYLTDTLVYYPAGGIWSASNNHASVSEGIVSGHTAGRDTIFYTIPNACGNIKDSIVVRVLNYAQCDSMDEIKSVAAAPDVMEVFPDPNMGWFTVRITNSVSEEGLLEISDVAGRIMCKSHITTREGLNSYDFSNYLPGAYFVIYTSSNTRKVLKVIVE